MYYIAWCITPILVDNNKRIIDALPETFHVHLNDNKLYLWYCKIKISGNFEPNMIHEDDCKSVFDEMVSVYNQIGKDIGGDSSRSKNTPHILFSDRFDINEFGYFDQDYDYERKLHQLGFENEKLWTINKMFQRFIDGNWSEVFDRKLIPQTSGPRSYEEIMLYIDTHLKLSSSCLGVLVDFLPYHYAKIYNNNKYTYIEWIAEHYKENKKKAIIKEVKNKCNILELNFVIGGGFGIQFLSHELIHLAWLLGDELNSEQFSPKTICSYMKNRYCKNIIKRGFTAVSHSIQHHS